MAMNLNTEMVDSRNLHEGFVKIWQHNLRTGKAELVVDKKNTILYTGSDVLAKALSGQPNSKISHMYLGYSNDPGVPVDNYAISKDSNLFLTDTTHGYVRLPLTFPASFTSSDITLYNNNIVVFTCMLTGGNGVVPGSQVLISETSRIYEAALVAAYNPFDNATNHPNDIIFARISFSPIIYSDSFSLTISWGIKLSS